MNMTLHSWVRKNLIDQMSPKVIKRNWWEIWKEKVQVIYPPDLVRPPFVLKFTDYAIHPNVEQNSRAWLPGEVPLGIKIEENALRFVLKEDLPYPPPDPDEGKDIFMSIVADRRIVASGRLVYGMDSIVLRF